MGTVCVVLAGETIDTRESPLSGPVLIMGELHAKTPAENKTVKRNVEARSESPAVPR